MSLTKNKVKTIIKKSFTKKLVNLGFLRLKDSLGGYRIRGDFVDVVGIQIGSNAGSLYLHYFTNLLTNRFMTNLLNTRLVGERLQGNENGGHSWITEVEEEVEPMLEEIWNSVECVAIPFFESFSNITEYSKLLDEAMSKSSITYPFDLVLMRAIEGRTEESKALISDIKKELLSDEDYDFEDDNEDIVLLRNLNSLENSILNSSQDELMTEWRSDNLKVLNSK